MCIRQPGHRLESYYARKSQPDSSIIVRCGMESWLPPELIRACLATLSANDLLAATQVCHGFSREASTDELWAALYQQRWPPWTLLSPLPLEHRERPRARDIYRRRQSGQMCLNLQPPDDKAGWIVDRPVKLLRGATTDEFDQNATPLDVVLCVAPAGQWSRDLEIEGKLLAQVNYGSGSKHNEPTTTTWVGKSYVIFSQSNAVAITWREPAATYGEWIYNGRLSYDGRSIEGTFHLSILPRKRGRFELRAVDPATHVGDAAGGLPTAKSLAMRVAVKRCSTALTKLVARRREAGELGPMTALD